MDLKRLEGICLNLLTCRYNIERKILVFFSFAGATRVLFLRLVLFGRKEMDFSKRTSIPKESQIFF